MVELSKQALMVRQSKLFRKWKNRILQAKIAEIKHKNALTREGYLKWRIIQQLRRLAVAVIEVCNHRLEYLLCEVN